MNKSKLAATAVALVLLAALTACAAPLETTVISPTEYEALDLRHMTALNVSNVIHMSWQNADEIDPYRLMNYYASAILKENPDVAKGWGEGYLIPEDELESYVQSRFDVSVEHLRGNEDYIAKKNAYEFGGLGSTSETKTTNAELTGNLLTVDYNVTGPMDYTVASGTLVIECEDGNWRDGGYRYLSNQMQWSAQYELAFPSASKETDRYGVLMMNSGSRSGESSDGGEPYKWYDGENLASIIGFYENEALPELEAVGTAEPLEDGWRWSGTYRNGKPLTIDVRRRFGRATYVITALYDEDSRDYIAENMLEREFMQPPNANNFNEVYDYLWPVFYSGILDTAWTTPENIEAPGLVAFYANSLNDEEQTIEEQAPFEAELVESYARRYFDISAETMRGWNVYDGAANAYQYAPAEHAEGLKIVSATSYGRTDSEDDGSPIRMVIAYEATPSYEDKTVLWSGELEVELSDKGYKYLSHTRYISNERP